MSEPLSLDPMAQAVSAARRYVRDALREFGAEELEESAELGISELVTNAVLHGRTPMTIALRRTDAGRIRVEVADRSPASPRQRRFDLSATTGRGLRLVESLSHDWGVDAVPPEQGGGKCVWFEPREFLTSDGFPEALHAEVDLDSLL
ncbi:anti-sigma regulatory factor (Ser/Thr protein kinase) [Kineococcus xinjiangensis]|uniref:Anti-sigma regulatory factor (Ser/Thr protein kinase) n=1 Tax=Kineococcus xinjiangensis TaxID=512762 RepID=A0A2S6IDJ9_9ACTN|nr:ATP-binding protein [Kineococcus xinjiangensis]PPK92295.1 anti-sigma regulatory factor (Ser/Thr protein kinase) [Kineococcus xinjiangensis]